MKFVFSFTIVLLFHLTFYGQKNEEGVIKGAILTNEGATLPRATVLLLNAKDSSLVKTNFTDKNGQFEFTNVPYGSYLLRVSHTGFKELASNINKLYSLVLEVKPILLELQSGELKEVKVEGRKPLVELQLDKIVINAGSSIISSGSTAIEVLQMSPGVTVAESGNISLKGKPSVQILINGKPTYLSATDIANMLRTMPATQLEKIEIISNPSSKYDAAGNGGVINLVLKKDQRIGTNGSLNFSYGLGIYTKIISGMSLNYRNKKLNIFGTVNYINRVGFTQLTDSRKFVNAGSLQSEFQQNSFTKQPFYRYLVRAGADYNASKKTIIGIMLLTYYGKNIVRDNNKTVINNFGTASDSSYITMSDNRSLNHNYAANLNLKSNLDTNGKTISIDIDYAKYNIRNKQQFITNYFNANSVGTGRVSYLQGTIPTDIEIISVKSDYSSPVNKNTSIEAGLKSSFTFTRNSIFFYKGVNANIPDADRNNKFNYNENINALYISLQRQYQKLSIQLGVRYENTGTMSSLPIASSKFKRNYNSILPTAFIQYIFSEKQQISFSYGRRINRPTYEYLNPFKYFSDPFVYQTGNADLVPETSNTAEVNYSIGNTVLISSHYSQAKNIITPVTIQDDVAKEIFSTNLNLLSFYNYGLSVNYSPRVTKWWQGTYYLSGYTSRYSGTLPNGQLNKSLTTISVNITNTFTISKSITAELSGFYNSSSLETFTITRPYGSMSGGIQKSVMNKKATIRLKFSDLFYTNKVKQETAFSSISRATAMRYDTRILTIGFNYRFGKKTVQQSRNRETGVEDEKDRIKISN